MEELQIVTFNVGRELYGVGTLQVKSIVKYEDVHEIAGMPDFMDGIKVIRGVNVPVISLEKKFCVDSDKTISRKKIVIVDISGMPAGFTVNDVHEIIKFTEAEFEPAPALIQSAGINYIKSVCKKGEKLITVLDLSAILSSEELCMIKEIV